ncbi:MAG: TetR/AcrR family transcriptional regulator [Chitinophagaceae bacterium]|nr:TetR/AcrR family transcriptional regulator [Chitinophagaceae bacterium]
MTFTEKKKLSKKELILERAAAMFREKGFAATSMRDLAESVGIEAASLYNHIHSKSQILEEIIFRMAKKCNEHLNDLDKPNVSCIEKVEAIIRFHVQMMINRFDDYHVMVNDWIHLTEPSLSDFVSQRREYVQRLEAILSDGIAKNEIRPIAPYVAILTILSSVRGLEFWHRSRKQISAREMEEHMVQHLLGGLKAK